MKPLSPTRRSWSRRLVDFLGLAWDDRCLAFYENKRPVYTYSLWGRFASRSIRPRSSDGDRMPNTSVHCSMFWHCPDPRQHPDSGRDLHSWDTDRARTSGRLSMLPPGLLRSKFKLATYGAPDGQRQTQRGLILKWPCSPVLEPSVLPVPGCPPRNCQSRSRHLCCCCQTELSGCAIGVAPVGLPSSPEKCDLVQPLRFRWRRPAYQARRAPSRCQQSVDHS